MKIAFTSTGTNWDSIIDPRFGRSEFILLHDDETGLLSSVDNSAVKNTAHGAGTATAQMLFELNPDVLITGNGPGDKALQALKHLKMKIYVNAHNMTIKQAYDHYKCGELNEF